MADFDYYKELQVSRSASTEEIRAAFRRLALRYHPDRNPGAEAKFKRIAEAYDVLSDPAKRAAYDRGGVEQVRVQRGYRTFESIDDVFRSFGDIFGERFREPARAGQDYETEMELSAEEASAGGRRSFTIEDETACGECGGASRACPRCGGEGVHGAPRDVELTIPRGIEDGAVLRLRGMGAPGSAGGKPGDLLVRVRVDGRAKARVSIDVVTAILGGRVRMGGMDVRIPPGTQPGEVLRVAGRDGRRETLITVDVEIPRSVTERQRRLLEEFRNEA